MTDENETFARIQGMGNYRPVYREHATNFCPGCGRTGWHVGRFSAECAFCATALPLQEGSTRGAYTHEERPAFFTRSGDGDGSTRQ